ncbi:MAG TPA: hypothetical protein VLC08_14990 [Chitinolyticbacter sp.]|nr:hypothetical protein [Chitinolyticbacter sp.]
MQALKVPINRLRRWLKREPRRKSACLGILASADLQAIVVEPWGIEFPLKTEGRYRLIAHADTAPWFEIEWIEKCLIASVHGHRATFELQLDHRPILDCPVATPMLSIERAVA